MFAAIRELSLDLTGAAPDDRRGERARRRPAWLPQRRPPAPRLSVSPAVVEEEAANLLYGERSGMVNASPVVPPVGDRADEPAGKSA